MTIVVNETVEIRVAASSDDADMLPTFWVLTNGEEQTAVTVHYMVEKLDAGEIVLPTYFSFPGPADAARFRARGRRFF